VQVDLGQQDAAKEVVEEDHPLPAPGSPITMRRCVRPQA
jgi:hypothetical protein